jgi:hypothetical protein
MSDSHYLIADQVDEAWAKQVLEPDDVIAVDGELLVQQLEEADRDDAAALAALRPEEWNDLGLDAFVYDAPRRLEHVPEDTAARGSTVDDLHDTADDIL